MHGRVGAIEPPSGGLTAATRQAWRGGQLRPRTETTQPGDAVEREADRLAEEALRRTSAAPRRCAACGGTGDACPSCRAAGAASRRMARQTSEAGAQPASAPVLAGALGHGHPLAPATRTFFESRFGYDFGRVRIHADETAATSARAVNARAYALGEQVVFGAGEYRPDSLEGQRLLAHELAHVVQFQRDAAPPVMARKQTPWPAWHQEVLQAIAKHAGRSNGRSAEPAWPKVASYLCTLSRERAASLHDRLSSTAAGVVGGTDDFSTYLQAKFPAHHARLQEMLHEIATGTTPDECRPKTVETPEDPPPAPPVPSEGAPVLRGEAPSGKCGPEIGAELTAALASVESTFTSALPPTRALACDTLLSPLTGGFAWEISQLFDRSWIALYQGCATDACRDSVSVDRNCHDPGAVNYVLFGTACRLCHDFYTTGGGVGLVDPFKMLAFSKTAMKVIITAWKQLPGKTNAEGARAWAEAGWDGTRPASAGYPQCEVGCGKIGNPLDWQWLPLTTPPKINELF